MNSECTRVKGQEIILGHMLAIRRSMHFCKCPKCFDMRSEILISRSDCAEQLKKQYGRYWQKPYREIYKEEYRKESNILRNMRNVKRRRKDILFRITTNLRSRVRMALKGHRKANTTFNLIGCTPQFFKHYITELFVEGMSWDNYGEWHIDHIRPCASFNLLDYSEQLKCFHYTNQQPLWAIDNYKKGSKLIK